MSKTLVIYFKQELSLDVIFEFSDTRNTYLEQAGNIQQIRHSKGVYNFWVFEDPTLIICLDNDELNTIEDKMGTPKSSFVIEMNKEENTINLVREFLSKLSDKLKFIVEIEDGSFLDIKQFNSKK